MWTALDPIPALSPTMLAPKGNFYFAHPIKGSSESLSMWQISLFGAP
jgi:hypothetical protein